MHNRPELVADIAGRMMRWVSQPALKDGRNIGGPRPPQVAARTLALAYVAGTTGNLSATKLARRLRMTPRRFAAYTAEARREFGLRNPHFSGHGWNFKNHNAA